MLTDKSEEYRTGFERMYGKDNWHGFVTMVGNQTRPNLIKGSFTSSRSGRSMNWPSYYLWEARAREVLQTR